MSWKRFPQAVLSANMLLPEMNNSFLNAFTFVPERLKIAPSVRPYHTTRDTRRFSLNFISVSSFFRTAYFIAPKVETRFDFTRKQLVVESS